MQLDDILKVESGGIFGGHTRVSWDEVGHFCKPVYADVDGIKTLGWGQFDNEVHGD